MAGSLSTRTYGSVIAMLSSVGHSASLYPLQGTPFASFPSTASCDLASHFDANNIIINLTFCTHFFDGCVYQLN